MIDRADPVVSRAGGPAGGMAGQADLAVAAFALACLTSGFWRLWPGAAGLSEPPLGALIVQAGLAALGFVALAAQWERSARAFARDPSAVVLLLAALASTGWSQAPEETLRAATVLFLVWMFGCGLAVRFKETDLARIVAFSAVFALASHFAGQRGTLVADRLDAEAGLAVAAFGWSAFVFARERLVWLGAMAGAVTCGLIAGDVSVLGALAGWVVGAAVLFVGRQGPVGLIGIGWIMVMAICVATMFVMFGAGGAGEALREGQKALGPAWLAGKGFGVTGLSAADGLGGGLGLWGIVLGVAIVGVSGVRALAKALANDPVARLRGADAMAQNHAGRGLFALWAAIMGVVALSPAEVVLTGPIIVILAVVAFKCALEPQSARAPLALRGGSSRAASLAVRPAAGTSELRAIRAMLDDARPATRPLAPPNAKGLRPRL